MVFHFLLFSLAFFGFFGTHPFMVRHPVDIDIILWDFKGSLLVNASLHIMAQLRGRIELFDPPAE